MNKQDRINNYHKALAELLHMVSVLIDIEDYSEGSSDRCSIEDAWEVLNTRGDTPPKEQG